MTAWDWPSSPRSYRGTSQHTQQHKSYTTNLELEIFFEDGSETVPFQPAALLDHFLPVGRDVGEIDLDGGVKPVLGLHQHTAVLPLQDPLRPVLLQLLVEFQADADVDLWPIIFGIGQSSKTAFEPAGLQTWTCLILPVEGSVKVCHSNQNTLGLLSWLCLVDFHPQGFLNYSIVYFQQDHFKLSFICKKRRYIECNI